MTAIKNLLQERCRATVDLPVLCPGGVVCVKVRTLLTVDEWKRYGETIKRVIAQIHAGNNLLYDLAMSTDDKLIEFISVLTPEFDLAFWQSPDIDPGIIYQIILTYVSGAAKDIKSDVCAAAVKPKTEEPRPEVA